MFSDDHPPIDDQIKLLAKALLDLGRVIVEAFIRSVDAGANDGVSEFLDEGQADLIMRDPNPDRILFGQGNLGDKFRRLENKGIGTWKEALHDLVRLVRHMGILADVFQIRANETEGLIFLGFLQSMDLPDCLRIEQIATHPINGVRGVSDHRSLSQDLHYFSNQPDLRILRIDGQYHGFSSLHCKNRQSSERIIFRRLLKKGQMQGSRNPEE